MTKSELLASLDNPRQLEKMYRDNKSAFKTEFNGLYPDLANHTLATYWHARLNYDPNPVSWGSNGELVFVIIASLFAGLIAKLPELLHVDPESFYQRNIGFIVFPVLASYFAWKKRIEWKRLLLMAVLFTSALVFINLLPANPKSDTLLLSCIHLPIFLWAITGFSFVGENIRGYKERLGFLRYNGDLVIMTALLGIAGGIFTALTIGLFHVIGFNIEKFYINYIAIFGLAALPLVSTYITQTNPQLVNRISPVIAKIFTPLVLITLVIYLVAIFLSGKDPYQDREFLMVFNLLLLGVMAIIFFSIAESSRKTTSRLANMMLLALSILTIVVNGIALSAILFRISSWGLTPNRLAIIGANLLMLTNLCMMAFQLFRNLVKNESRAEVEHTVSMFLPVYVIWVMIVTFIFPFIFQFS